jgi:nitrite reductase/ring-hydroxylating ferredoxin subunit
VTTRRTVLCGLAGGVLAPGLLAACSGGSSGGDTTPVTAGTPVTPLADVPVGGGTVVTAAGRPVLVVQPAAGQVAAFDARCPHAGVTVGAARDGVVVCPAHGSRFDPATGAVRQGPASTGLTPVAVRVDGDQVVTA